MFQRTLQCGELLKRLHDLMEKNANRNLQELGVTLSQMKMLFILHELPERSATMKELERFFGVTQATIAGTVVRLEKKALIESYMDEGDKRVKHVRLSPEGHDICRRAAAQMERNEEWLVRALSAEEQEELRRLLQKLYDANRKHTH